MANKGFIGPEPVSTPVDYKQLRTTAGDLPPDLMREASDRLGAAALLVASLWVLGDLSGHIAARAMGSRWLSFDISDLMSIVSISLSLILYAFVKREKRDPRFVLNLGLVYLNAIALALALMWHWQDVPPDYKFEILPQISWVGALVLIFAAIVPTSPRKMLVAGLIAASMNPVSMVLAKTRHSWDFGPTSNVLLMHYPDFILVFASVVIAHVITKLGQKVRRAREMGSYQLGELLGKGGMGEVYKATHRMLARPAAIKLIRPEMLGAADDDTAKLAVIRFRREAEAAANLRSPHTVELYDFGVTEDGTLYLVMEFLDGMDLETFVRKNGPLPPGRVSYILRQVCESLDEAHSYGLVHRDIKPANIHVGRVGRKHDFVKVLDFGLVKPAADLGTEDSLATIPGQVAMGTPAYMSPEMALGEPVDGRSDIYALGCVAYYLLTGSLVFDADKTVQMIAKHLQSEPVPPSQRAPQAIPPALERLVMRCLAKDPALRPQTAAQLAQALELVPTEAWNEQHAMNWWEANIKPTPQAVSA
ncbi:MAG TPA: serine/threonine-protein kinase [Gemmatimonadaceae bacterium]|jgi:serine/threonine-protein kinase